MATVHVRLQRRLRRHAPLHPRHRYRQGGVALLLPRRVHGGGGGGSKRSRRGVFATGRGRG